MAQRLDGGWMALELAVGWAGVWWFALSVRHRLGFAGPRHAGAPVWLGVGSRSSGPCLGRMLQLGASPFTRAGPADQPIQHPTSLPPTLLLSARSHPSAEVFELSPDSQSEPQIDEHNLLDRLGGAGRRKALVVVAWLGLASSSPTDNSITPPPPPLPRPLLLPALLNPAYAADNGVLLVRLARIIDHGEATWRYETQQPAPLRKSADSIRVHAQAQSHSFQARDNVSQFLDWCRGLGVSERVIFETNDLVQVSTTEKDGTVGWWWCCLGQICPRPTLAQPSHHATAWKRASCSHHTDGAGTLPARRAAARDGGTGARSPGAA